MKKIFAIMVSAILILCILSGCGSPNVSNPSNENTLHVANHADIIVAGKVSDSSKYVMSADSTYKTSTVSIDVSDVYKGGILTGDSVTVEINTYLGVNGVIAEHEPLPPTFSSNDSVLLFLVANDHGSYYIAGVNQGAYFKSVTKSTDAIQYERQNRLGFGPETFMLADMLEYIEN